MDSDTCNNVLYLSRTYLMAKNMVETNKVRSEYAYYDIGTNVLSYTYGREGKEYMLMDFQRIQLEDYNICDGIEQCNVALLKKSKNLLDANFIEGMACVGGCVGGAGCLTHGIKNRNEIDKYGKEAGDKKIMAAIKNS